MEKEIYLLCRRDGHAFHLQQVCHFRFGDLFDAAKMVHESLSAHLPNALDIIQNRMEIPFIPQLSMIGDGKAMHFILNTGHQLEAFGGQRDVDLLLMEQKSSGSVLIILHHAADG